MRGLHGSPGTSPAHRPRPALAPLLLTLLALTLLPSLAHARASAGGFVEVRFAATPGVDGTWWQTVERFRPRFEAKIADRVSLYTEVEMALAQGRNPILEFQRILDESDFGPLLEAAGNEWPTKRNEVLQIDGPQDMFWVERLYLDIYLPKVDLRIGRQALFWGSAIMLNPTDPFPQLLIAEPWRPRQGTNAARATVALGDKHDFTGVIAASDAFDAFRAAGRLRLRFPWADMAVVAAFRGDDNDAILGVDLRGTLGVGWWVEAALHIDETVHEEIAIGIDYSFPLFDSFIVTAQYYRNGRGAGPKDEPAPGGSLGQLAGALDLGDSPLAQAFTPDDAATEAPEPETFPALLQGRDYFLLSLAAAFAPEVSASFFALQNLSDGTGFIVPSVTVSPTGWLSLALNAQIPYRLWGDGGEFKPAKDDLVLSTEIPVLGTYEADFSPLVPPATITFWTRVNF